MQNIFKLLQFFADEGDAAPGVSPDAAGQDVGVTTEAATQEPVQSTDVSFADKLSNLGVPKDRIRAKYNKPVKAEAAPAAQTAAVGAKANEITWDQVKDAPAVKDEVSKIVRARLSESEVFKERLGKFAPALEVLARQYGMDGSDLDKLDYDALSNAISADSHYYEAKANEMGVDLETAKHIDELEREKQRRDRAESERIEERQTRQKFERIVAQAKELQKTFPNFDLRAEMANPNFMRLIENVGFSVEDAYHAIHRKEIQAASAQAIAQGVSAKMSNAIQSGINRPVENGASSQASSVSTMSYRTMAKADRDALKQRIMRAAANGEKIYPTG